MILQRYELNNVITNVEMVLYKIFFSPLTTEEERKAGNDKENLLLGNIFALKKISMPIEFYRSVLQTLMIKDKKKHFKKLVAYITEIEEPSNISPVLLN